MKLVSAVVMVFTLVAPVLAQQSPPGSAQTPGQPPSTSAPSSSSQPMLQIDSSSIVGSPVRSPDGKDLDLEFIIRDYVVHMRHHLDQIL